MKKIHFSAILFFLFITLSIKSQSYEQLLNIHLRPGYAILAKGDTLVGSFEFNDSQDNYKLLIFKDPVTNKRKAFEPNEINFFSIDDKYYRPKQIKNEWFFVRVVFEDSINVYIHRKYYGNSNGTGYYNQFLIEKRNGNNILITADESYPFKEKVSEFFNDCPIIVKKLKTNVFKPADILKIAADYDDWIRTEKRKN